MGILVLSKGIEHEAIFLLVLCEPQASQMTTLNKRGRFRMHRISLRPVLANNGPKQSISFLYPNLPLYIIFKILSGQGLVGSVDKPLPFHPWDHGSSQTLMKCT